MGKQEKAALVKSLLDSKKVETFDEQALLALSVEQPKPLAPPAGGGLCPGGGGGRPGGGRAASDRRSRRRPASRP